MCQRENDIRYIVAAERGHKAIIYEKNAFLGGLLRHTDFDPFKWPQKDFKDYLVRQLNKTRVEVQLSAAATPEMIKTRGYDSVLVAIGMEPVIPKIPGSDGSNVWNTVSVMGKEKSLGKNVVFVGGGEWGTESAMGLAKLGHKVTIVSSDKLPEVSSIFLCGTGRDAAVLISESVRRSHRYSKSNTHREKH